MFVPVVVSRQSNEQELDVEAITPTRKILSSSSSSSVSRAYSQVSGAGARQLDFADTSSASTAGAAGGGGLGGGGPLGGGSSSNLSVRISPDKAERRRLERENRTSDLATLRANKERRVRRANAAMDAAAAASPASSAAGGGAGGGGGRSVHISRQGSVTISQGVREDLHQAGRGIDTALTRLEQQQQQQQRGAGAAGRTGSDGLPPLPTGAGQHAADAQANPVLG